MQRFLWWMLLIANLACVAVNLSFGHYTVALFNLFVAFLLGWRLAND